MTPKQHAPKSSAPSRAHAPRAKRGERPDWSPRERPARPAHGRAPEWPERRPRRDDADRRAPRREPREVREPAVHVEVPEDSAFAALGLGANLVRELAALGALEPFPIQQAAIPAALEGRDVLGRGRTGSGKTIAFGAPVVERLLRLHREANPGGAKGRSMGRAPRALILAPTRELAQQIDRTVQRLARSVGLFTIAIVGGVPYQKQLTGLRRGVDIVIGTPGRIQDLLDQGELDFSEIAMTVLDEADHMCDLGFLEPVQEILRATPAGSQRLLFSATLDRAVESLVEEFLDDPAVHEVEDGDQASSTIEHQVWLIDASAKRDTVRELVAGAARSIVFARTRAFAEDLATGLEESGVAAASLHGDLNQAKRNRSLAALTRGEVRALIATDVAARGIHVDDVDLVVQADMPDDPKAYLHRAGRTGRAGAQGLVITLISPSRRRRLEELLREAGIEAVWEDKATTRPRRNDGGERAARADRPAWADRPRTPRPERNERTERPAAERRPRLTDEEYAEFQAWKAAKAAAEA